VPEDAERDDHLEEQDGGHAHDAGQDLHERIRRAGQG
jgi:hypothetical protein